MPGCPARASLRGHEGRRVARAAGAFELLFQGLDVGVTGPLLGDAGPLHGRHGLGQGLLGGALRAREFHRIEDEKLEPVVAQADCRLSVPQLRQFLVAKAALLEHVDGGLAQLRRLVRVDDVGDLVGEELVLALGEVGPLLRQLERLTLLGGAELVGHDGDPFLLRVPAGVAGKILARELLDIRKRADVGELAGLLLLQGLQQHRQRGLVVLPGPCHRLALGLRGLALVGGFVLTAADVAVTLLFALRQVNLQLARQGSEPLLFLRRPRPGRLDGRKVCFRFGRLRLAAGLILRGGVGPLGQFLFRRGSRSRVGDGSVLVPTRARRLGRIRSAAAAMPGDGARGLARVHRLLTPGDRRDRGKTLGRARGGFALQIHVLISLRWRRIFPAAGGTRSSVAYLLPQNRPRHCLVVRAA